MKVELIVQLTVPDTTAITAAHTLNNMGLPVKTVQRLDWYAFELSTADFQSFAERIKKVDVLVNANKHKAFAYREGDIYQLAGIGILVKEHDPVPASLLKTLQHRLGFSEIISMEKGTLWVLDTDQVTAQKAASQLLANRHFQSYRMLL